MAKSPRANRKLSADELVRFLDLLSRTGNFALACDRLGRAKSGLYKRRLRDLLFDSECIASLAVARMNLPSSERETKGFAVTTYAGRPQLRRAMPGTMGRSDLRTFLQTLAATGNTRFAAQSVGVAPSSIYARRRRDPQFDAAVETALDIATTALELRVIEASGALCDDWGEAPDGKQAIANLTIGEALHFLTLHSRRRTE